MDIRLAKGVKDEFDGACLWYQGMDRHKVDPFKTETLRVLDEVTKHPYAGRR
jgi:hypothetical protein